MNSARTSGRAGTGIQVYPTQGPCSDTGHHRALGVWFSSNFTTHPHDTAVGEGVGGGMGSGGAGSLEMQMLRFTPRNSDSVDLKWARRLIIHQ